MRKHRAREREKNSTYISTPEQITVALPTELQGETDILTFVNLTTEVINRNKKVPWNERLFSEKVPLEFVHCEFLCLKKINQLIS